MPVLHPFPPGESSFRPGRRAESRPGAFTLVELLTVVSIMAVLLAMVVPAITGVLKGKGIDNAARQVMNLLTVARTEAITQRKLVRFMVASDWQGSPLLNYRKVSLWSSGNASDWTRFTPWEELPSEVILDTAAGGYCTTMTTANFMFASGGVNTFSTTLAASTITARYIEFTPLGAVRLPVTPTTYASGPEIWFAIASGHMSGTTVVRTSKRTAANLPNNWAMISANIYTGRFKLTRP